MLDHGRFLVVAEDDTVLLVEEGQIVWRREEGLARAQSTLFLDLPAAATDVEADYQAMRPSLMDRVNAEILTVKVSPLTRAVRLCLEVFFFAEGAGRRSDYLANQLGKWMEAFVLDVSILLRLA